MTSLPSINPMTLAKIKVAINAYGTDAEFLARFVESLMKINAGTGFGKITVYLTQGRISSMRSEETHAFSDTKEFKFEDS